MICFNCQTPMTGRKRKFCTKNCGTKYAIANNPRRCDVDGCDKRHVAKGMCKSHYNETLPSRHRKVEKACDVCGASCLKSAHERRYNGTYCSLRCRDDAIRKVWPTSLLPDDHWARWFGATSAWSRPLPKPAFQCGSCVECGDNITEPAAQVPSVYCSQRCARRVGKRTRRAREHEAPGSFYYSQILAQYRRQGSVCAYCKNPATGLPDPEHVTPLSRGGRNDMSNLVAACRACNTDKSDHTLAEWASSRQERGLTPRDTALDSAAYRHLYIIEATSRRMKITA